MNLLQEKTPVRIHSCFKPAEFTGPNSLERAEFTRAELRLGRVHLLPCLGVATSLLMSRRVLPPQLAFRVFAAAWYWRYVWVLSPHFTVCDNFPLQGAFLSIKTLMPELYASTRSSVVPLAHWRVVDVWMSFMNFGREIAKCLRKAISFLCTPAQYNPVTYKFQDGLLIGFF